MATTISSGTNPYKKGSPPDFGTLYSGRALEFDGVVDYISTPSINMGTTHTFSCWLNTSTTQKGVMGIDDENFPIYLNANLQIQYDATGTPVTSADSIVSGVWNHVVVTRTGTTVNYYINGVIDSGGADTINSDDALSGVFIIGGLTTTTFLYDGKLSNVQFWDAVWSASDVQYAYTHPEKLAYNTPGTSLTSSNLKAWYPMTEGNPRSPQTSVYDGSGGGNHGTTTFYGDELHTLATCTSPTNEDDATTGWTNVGLSLIHI